MSERFLIQQACVLTLGTRTKNHAEADVLIENGTVAEIGQGLRARNATLIDGSNTIAMPGFVDAHRRAWQALFKNEGSVDSLSDEVDPSPDEVYAGTLISLLGAIEAGITTVVDWYDGPATEAHVDAALRAHGEVGVRTVLVLAADRDAIAVWNDTISRHGIQPSPLTSLSAGLPRPSEADPSRAVAAWEGARHAGLRIHVLAGPAERGWFVELQRDDLLRSDVTVAHCTGVSDDDLDALSASGSSVVITPSSDMAIGPGTPPMQALLDRGIRPGLGVDDERIGPGDVLAQMRSAISIQHAKYFDLKLAGKGGLPNLLSTRDVIKYGTIDGARAAGLDAVTGSLEVGKQADLILLRTDRPNIYPINDPIGAVVWGVDTSNLDWMFVNGRVLMRDGVIAADVSQPRDLAVEARQQIGASAAGNAAATAGGHE